MLSRSESFVPLALPSSARSMASSTPRGLAGDGTGPLVGRAAFAVRHSHCDVAYSPRGWLRGASTTAWTGLGETIATSSSPFVARLGRMLRADARRSESTMDTAPMVARLLDWLADEEALLQESEPHVIRCIHTGSAYAKPGLGEPERLSLSDPLQGSVVRRPLLSAAAMLDQITGAALPPAVAMRAHGFPFRTPCPEFYERYVVVEPRLLSKFGPTLEPVPPGCRIEDEARIRIVHRSMCQKLAEAMCSSVPGFADRAASADASVQVGRTRVFLTGRALSALERSRAAVLRGMERAAIRIQTHTRSLLVRLDVRQRWRAAVRIQAGFRCWRERQAYLYFLFHATVIARFLEARIHRRAFVRARWAATLLKSAWHRKKRRKAFLRLREAAVSVHILARGFLVRQAILSRHRSLLRIQRTVRAFLVRARIRWARVRAALLLQALWRGYTLRMRSPEVVARIREFRVKVAKLRFFRHAVAAWRGRMVRRRLLEMAVAARRIQSWVLTSLHKVRFWRTWSAAVKVQAVVRGILARRAVANAVAVNLAAERAWSVQRLRAGEKCVVDDMAASLHSVAFWQHIATADPGLVGLPTATKSAAFMTRPLDVDTVGDDGPHGVAALNAAENIEDGLPVDSDELVRAGLPSPPELARQLAQNRGSPSWSAAFEALETRLAQRGVHTVGVALGSTHSAILDSAGRVHAWGWNDRGQLGAGSRGDASLSPLPVTALSHGPVGTRPTVVPAWTPRTRVVSIAAGSDHTVAVSSSGAAYAWGGNSHGQCGLGHFDDVATPTGVVSIRRKVGSVAAGARHTVFLTAAGSLYACGERACVGIGGETMAPLAHAGHGGDIPTPVGVAALTMHKIRKVAAGWQHTLALATTGDLFAWGDGSRGQLGWGRRGSRPVPCLVEMSADSVFAQHDGGGDDEADSRAEGKTAPRGEDVSVEDLVAQQEVAQRLAEARAEKLSAGLRSAERSLMREERLATRALLRPSAAAAAAASAAAAARKPSMRCVGIACGGSHSLALTSDGVVVAFGANDCGQLGVGDTRDRLRPRAVMGHTSSDPGRIAGRGGGADPSSEDNRVVSISAGWRSSHAITASHAVYQWGHCGAVAEEPCREEIGMPLDGSDPETFLAPVVRDRPRRVPLPHSEGYRPLRVIACGSPAVSVSLATFSTQRTTDEMVRAAMGRVADLAEQMLSSEGAPDGEAGTERPPAGQLEGQLGMAGGAGDAQESGEDDETEAIGMMLSSQPGLRHTYALALIAARNRDRAVSAARSKALAAGLAPPEVAALVEQAAAQRSPEEDLIDETKADYVEELRLRRRFAGADLTPGELRSRKGAGARRLAGRWAAMSVAERFIALGLSRRHLALLTPQQLARLAFALRQSSHSAARPFLASSLGASEAMQLPAAAQESVHGYHASLRGLEGGSTRFSASTASPGSRAAGPRAPHVSERARPRSPDHAGVSVAASPSSPGGGALSATSISRGASSPSAAAAAAEVAVRSRAELSGFASMVSAPSDSRSKVRSARAATAAVMDEARRNKDRAYGAGDGATPLQRLEAALSIDGADEAAAVSRGIRQTRIGHGVASRIASSPVSTVGYLLPGGRFDTAREQQQELARLDALKANRRLKEARAADRKRRAAEWRRSREGTRAVDVAGFFTSDKLVGASRRLVDSARAAGESSTDAMARAWRRSARAPSMRLSGGQILQGTTAALVSAARASATASGGQGPVE